MYLYIEALFQMEREIDFYVSRLVRTIQYSREERKKKLKNKNNNSNNNVDITE